MNYEKEMNYKKDMEIDESGLDVEWLDQTSLAFKYGKNWAEKQRDLEMAQEEIKLIRSELIEEATGDPEKYLGAEIKSTVSIVEAYYRNHKRHKDQKDKIVQLQFEANVALIAKTEVGVTRKKALENLVTLHGQQYFAGPSIPRDLKVLKAQKVEKVQAAIGSKLTRKRKDV